MGLYVRSSEATSRKTQEAQAPVRQKATTVAPVAEPPRKVFSVGSRGERLAVAMDEVCLKKADGKASYVKLDPPATPATIKTRLREFAPEFEALPVAYPEDEERNEANRVVVTRQLRVQLPPESAARVASANGLDVTERPSYAPEWVIMDAADPMAALAVLDGLRSSPAVASADVLVARQRSTKALPNDTLISQQWHLKNTTTSPNITHANVENAWNFGGTGGVRGTGIRIGIVDDGLQTTHPDLSNIDTVNDKDWNNNDNDPNPEDDDNHGTAVAGVAGAAGNNSQGVSGVAPSSTLVGMRLVGGFLGITDNQEAEAMDWRNDIIQVKNNSWGPSDLYNRLVAPEPLTALALKNAAETGRGGKGTIFVWAGGNGKDRQNNSNYDGYANSIYTIAVTATDSLGQSAYYSEPGANILISAPSSGSGGALGVVTTDRTGNLGYNTSTSSNELADRSYTKTFGGTSSATPVVSGVVALMLEKNPNLGWRDVQEILIRSATPFLTTDPGWKTNGAGLKFNHQFGAGLVNAAAAVNMAATWTNLTAQTSLAVSNNTPLTIPNLNDTGVSKSFVFTSTTHRVEQVTVKLTADHTNRGNLDITLTSPSGMVSQLSTVSTNAEDEFEDWTFSTVQHWGESATGTWTLRVSDRSSLGNATGGTLGNCQVTLFGSSTAPVNPAPQVAITSPTPGQEFSLGATVNVQVAASDVALDGNPGVITNVELLVNDSVVASDASAPYEFTFNPGPGAYSLVARATDSEGGVKSSAAVAITVANQAPVITAASLSSTAPTYADQSVTVLNVTASDPEGSPITFAYQWQSSPDQVTYTNEVGKTSSVLFPAASNAGKVWRCVITASDGSKTSTPFTTAEVNLLVPPKTLVRTGAAYQYSGGLLQKGVEEVITRRAIINEFSQGPSGFSRDWVELLVLQGGSISGFQMTEAQGVSMTFNTNSIWNNVPAGTLIVVYRSGQMDGLIPTSLDTDPSDGRMVVPSTTTYFATADWITLQSEGDSISLKVDGSPIHSLCFGTFATFPLYVGDVPAGRSAYFAGGKDLDANLAANWGTATATATGSAANPGTGVTPGAANTTANQSLITKLRTNALVSPSLFRLGTGSVLPTGLTLNTSTGLISGTVSPGNVGDHTVTIERYNVLGEVVSQTFTLTVAPANFAEWIGRFSVANATAAGDPDADGLPNLIEYMLGSDPKVLDTTALTTEFGEGTISLTYRESKLPADATLVVEWSTGLAAGEIWQTTGLTTQLLEEDTKSRLLKVTLAVAPEDPKRFLRVRAATAP